MLFLLLAGNGGGLFAATDANSSSIVFANCDAAKNTAVEGAQSIVPESLCQELIAYLRAGGGMYAETYGSNSFVSIVNCTAIGNIASTSALLLCTRVVGM